MSYRYLTCAETAALVRQEMKATFPATRFSVKSSTYSMGASIHVSWVEGPSTSEVHAVTDALEGADFDGMQDLKIDRPPIVVGAEPVWSGADYIFLRRLTAEDAARQKEWDAEDKRKREIRRARREKWEALRAG